MRKGVMIAAVTAAPTSKPGNTEKKGKVPRLRKEGEAWISG
jgi:hypothetical protein